MSDVAIRAEHLSKLYHIGKAQRRHDTLRDALVNGLHAPLRWLRRNAQDSDEASGRLWALQDLSLEVKRGEVVGIIGRNGAGKSTLLKILSRITEPTEGEVDIHGRVGSLLEVGTGFHPELTGRENIYLNGAILGMRRMEIDRKFDEIVAFAEIEDFLETPVKHYSSGMYVRLAFAVAAHLEPEILIVDEVLAVGDAVFQKKCLGKMGNVAKQGRTILFVSHNMGAITQLCPRVMVLARGRCELDCGASDAVHAYLSDLGRSESTAVFDLNLDQDVQIVSMSVMSCEGGVTNVAPHTDPISVVIEYRVGKWPVGSYVCLDVFNEADLRLLWSSDAQTVDDMLLERSPGFYRAQVMIPGAVLSPGRYYFTGAIYAPGRRSAFDARERAVSVEITDGGSLLSNFGIRPHAATMIPLVWDTKRFD